MTNLTHLWLAYNQLTGEIPGELGNLASLEHLDLSGNQLRGEIPSELAQLNNPEWLDFHGNRLAGWSGCIPPGILWAWKNRGDLAYCVIPVADGPAGDPRETFLSRCSNGVAVFEPEDNPGLVSDCAALLESVGFLGGSALLNWSSDTPIRLWDGVEICGSPGRVKELSLGDRDLPFDPKLLSNPTESSPGEKEPLGVIPSALGSLTSLEKLDLSGNRFKGTIPPELGI